MTLAPASDCLACGEPTRLRFGPRKASGPVPADELRCTSPYLGEHGEIWACPGCGLAYQALDGDPAELLAGYADVEDPLYLTEEQQRRAEFRELLERVEAHREPGTMLEVGSFAGLCLDEAAKRGWAPTGLEPSRWAASHAREAYGAEVLDGTLADAPWGPGSFDAVVMWDVLEHVPDPLADLRRMRELAVAGGVVALTTVNIAGRSARLLRGRWPWLMRMHLWYFTPASLRLLFVKAGFAAVHIEPHPKRLRLGYVLERAERYGGPLARAARRGAERTGAADRVVSIDLGDLVLAVGRT